MHSRIFHRAWALGLVISLVATVLPLGTKAAPPNEYSDDVSVVNYNPDTQTATLLASATAEKKKAAQELAAQSAFNALLHTGLPEIKNGVPMLSGPTPSFDYRFFHEGRYINYIDGQPRDVSSKKVANRQHATVQLTVKLRPLLAELNRNKMAVSPGWSDSKAVNATAALNPTIVVVPNVTEADGGYSFETMRQKVEKSPVNRHVVDRLSQEFASRGYKTRDFLSKLQNSKTSEVVRGATQTDAATMLVQEMPGDIVVTAQVDVNSDSRGNSECTVTLRAVERQTAGVLAATTFASGKYMLNDPSRLADYAVSKISNEFFNQLKSAFETMVARGREMNIEFSLASDVDSWTFDDDSPATGDNFKDVLDEWLRDNAFQSVYEMGSATDKYIAATLNIPLWDSERNRSLSVSNFNSKLRKFLKQQLGDEYKPNITSMGQKIIVVVE